MSRKRKKVKHRPAKTRQGTVAGESARRVLAALVSSDRWEDDDGMYRMEMSLAEAEAAPLVRAFMRVDAELELADANLVGTGVVVRTQEQRGADALVEVAKRARRALAIAPQA